MLPYINTVFMRADPPAPPREQQYLRDCIDEDLAMARYDGRLRDDATPAPRSWLTEGDHKRLMRQMTRELKHYKKSCQGEELEAAYQSFLDGREKEMHDLQDQRWSLIISIFADMVGRPERSHVRLAGGQKAFYEVMFRCQPAKFISRARFLTAMRLVYGFDLANMDAPSDGTLTDTLNTLYNSFDVFHQDRVDWRAFLFMVRVAHDYYEAPKDHLLWGFSLYGSEGSMDFEDCGGVRLQDILDLLNCLTLRHKRKDIEAIFLTTWMEMVRQSITAQKLTEKTLLKGQNHLETRISLPLFRQMLGLSPLKEVFTVVARHGQPDHSPWVYLFESKYMHPVALYHICVRRRERRNLEQCQAFIKETNLRNKARTMQMWWKYIFRRCRMRYLLQAMVVRFSARNINAGLLTWRFWTIAPASAVTIQRAYRGYLARLEYRVRQKLYQAALLVQCAFRRHVCQRKLRGYLAKRVWAAIEIQRHARGLKARRFARTKVVTHVDNQLYRIARERAALQSYPLEYAAMRIQTRWRCYWTRKKYKLALAAYYRKLAVEEQMRLIEVENQRQRLIYQKQIEAHYAKMRQEAKQKVLDDRRVIEVKWDMRKRQRQRRYEDRLARVFDEKNLEATNFEQRTLGFMESWEQKKKDRAEAVRAHILKVLADPDNDSERAEKKELERLIKQRVPSLAKTLDKKGLRLETWQLEEVARDELIDARVEEEKKMVHAEMIEAAKEFQRQREEAEAKMAEAMGKTEETRRERAALIIQINLYRPYKARRRIREVCCRRYKKLFDPKTHQAYYYNTRTGIAQWHKPYVMGTYDLEMKDEWYGMQNDPEKVDENMRDIKYYYNPKTLLIEWKQPPGTIVCDNCKFEFAKRRTSKDKKYFCEACWESSFQDKPERYETAWKPLEGGNVKAKDTSIELYPDRFDEDPKILEAYNNQLRLEAQAAEEQALSLTEYQQEQEAYAYDFSMWANNGTLYDTNSTTTSLSSGPSWDCQSCGKMKASRYCYQCNLYFCSVCSLMRHSKRDPAMACHQVDDVTAWLALQSSNNEETVASDVSSITWARAREGGDSIESVEEEE